MAATEGSMTNIQAPQNMFLPPVDDSENNRINFRDSLKFFQEQLLTNGASFPSPSTVCKNGSDIYKKTRLRLTKDQSVDITKDCDVLEEDIQSLRSCQLSIPTVDTILESVRVLRAIQKSQKERGSSWSLDISTKTDIEADFNLRGDWMQESPTNRWVLQQELHKVVHKASTEVQQELLETGDNSAQECSAVKTEENDFKWPDNTFDNKRSNEDSPPVLLGTELNEKTRVPDINSRSNTITDQTPEELPNHKTAIENRINISSENELNNEVSDKTHYASSCDNSTLTNNQTMDTSETANDTQNQSDRELVKTLSATHMLKIETYDDLNSQKDFLLPESLWKDEGSPNGSCSMKLEINDSDSGVGTQRSASSSSPNMPSQMNKDSWSDTSSSHYASAECSPYQSLNSVFDPPTSQKISEQAKDDLASSEHKSSQEREPEKSDRGRIPLGKDDFQFFRERSSCCEPNDYIEDDEKKIEEITRSDEKEGKTDYLRSQKDIEQDTEHFYSFAANTTVAATKNASRSISENIKELPYEYIDIHHDFSERREKFTTASCDLVFIVESLYSIKESQAFQVFPQQDDIFEKKLYILSEGAFQENPEDYYLVRIEDSVLNISNDSEIVLTLNMKYGEVSIGMKNTLRVDNKMGRCIYIKCDFEPMVNLKTEIELHCLKHWQTDCLQLVHYPLKHQNTIIIDLGSNSTRAGILMDRPTLPSIFFPTICATNRKTGENIYGMDALNPEVRQHSTISFPCRPSLKITKHTIDIACLEGLFEKIFKDLKVNPENYTVLVCLPRNLSIPSQTALVYLLLEKLKVKSVSLANQALLSLYAYDVSTAIVINIGERTEILPVVDGFIVDGGVTKLPLGGQSLIDQMKHGLAEKHVNLSSDIDSYVVQYIIEQVAYVANDYENELRLSSKHPNLLQKTVTLQSATTTNLGIKSITLDEARFKVCEGLFNPELWGIDSPGIHQLVNKAIQATGVDVRKKIAANIYVSGGMTMLPGFVERLRKEVAKISKAKIVPEVFASNYRHHCTYVGACNFAKMDVFPQVCISSDEFSRDGISSLKKCALCF